MMCLMENPISNKGAAIGSGGGEWDLALVGCEMPEEPIAEQQHGISIP